MEKKKLLARAALVLPSVTTVPDPAVYYSINKNDNDVAVGHACMSSIINGKFDYLKIHVLKQHGLTEKDVRKWCVFMTRCSFKCSFRPIKNSTNSIGVIEVDANDYVGAMHLKIAMTTIRYIAYHRQLLHTIPSIATKIYDEYPELDAYQALLLSHYGVGKKFHYFDSVHGLVYLNSMKFPRIISKEILFERIKKTTSPYAQINDVATTYKQASFGTVEAKELSELFSNLRKEAIKGNWKFLIDNLYE